VVHARGGGGGPPGVARLLGRCGSGGGRPLAETGQDREGVVTRDRRGGSGVRGAGAAAPRGRLLLVVEVVVLVEDRLHRLRRLVAGVTARRLERGVVRLRVVAVLVQAGEVVVVPVVVAVLARARLAGGPRLGRAPGTPAGARRLLRFLVEVVVHVVGAAAGGAVRGTPRTLLQLLLRGLLVVVVVVVGRGARPQGAQPQDDEEEDDDDDDGDERDDHGEYTTLGPVAW